MRQGVHFFWAAACAVAALAAPTTARAQAIEIGPVVECLEAVPAAVASPLAGDPIEVRVHYVLDQGITVEDAKRAVDYKQEAYARLGMTLIPSFTTATFSSDETEDLFRELKALFGGVRPPWAHLVYMLTRRDIRSGAAGSAVAGQADCIGGVMYPETSFGVGEFRDEPSETDRPVFDFETRATSKIGAHELGHLFGAHHHYANCAESAAQPAAIERCTLMFNDAGLISLQFSSVNASVVRGHALTYLAPVTASPPPDGSVTVPPPAAAASCEMRTYVDPQGDHAAAAVNQPDDVDLLSGTFNTRPDGIVTFDFKIASLDGDFSPSTATTAIYRLFYGGMNARSHVRVEWDGKNAPVAFLSDSSGERLQNVDVTLHPGLGGVIRVVLPLEQMVDEDGVLTLGRINGLSDADQVVSWDSADPAVPKIQPLACLPKTAPQKAVPAAGHDADHPAQPAPTLRVDLLRRGTRVRLAGTARDVRIRLTDARGRVVASGRAARVKGTRVVRMTSRRRLRRGTYFLKVTAAGTLVASRAVRLR